MCDARHANSPMPPGGRCPQFLSLFRESLARRQVARATANDAGKPHKFARTVVALPGALKVVADQLPLRHADPRRGLFDPTSQLFCRTKSNCLTHMAKMKTQSFELSMDQGLDRVFKLGHYLWLNTLDEPTIWGIIN